MITAWDVALWLSGYLAGAGTVALLIRVIPQRHHFSFGHNHNVHLSHQVHVRSSDDGDTGENWKTGT